MTHFEDSRGFAEARDHDDPLARYRDQFIFPKEKNGYSSVYLCGNSLGLQPKLAAEYVQNELSNWAEFAVDGHFHSDRPWISYHRRATDGFAELTGALPLEVVAMNTLTVNLHILMASFYKPSGTRYKIVIESQAFPSDRYAAASQLCLHGWWGHDEATRFKMSETFTPAKGAELWQMSNPPILSLAPVVASLQIFQEVGMAALVEKSTSLTSYLAWLLEQRFGGRIGTITPADDRGCHLSLVVKDSQVSARRLFDNLCERNVTGDWREPDVIRVAPVPLYNNYSDVYELVDRLNSAL